MEKKSLCPGHDVRWYEFMLLEVVVLACGESWLMEAEIREILISDISL